MIMAYKTDDVFSFGAFDPAKLTEGFRDFAEKSAAQSRDAYAKMKTATEEATRTAETTLQSAQSGSVEIGLKAIEARSEEHTSELQSLMRISSAVFCLKKTKTYQQNTYPN